MATKAPATPTVIPDLKSIITGLRLYKIVVIIPTRRAISTDQIPITCEVSILGKSNPMAEKSKPLGYHCGIRVVNTLFKTPTSTTGTNANIFRPSTFFFIHIYFDLFFFNGSEAIIAFSCFFCLFTT